MRKRLRKKLHRINRPILDTNTIIDYCFSGSELRDPFKKDSLRRAAKGWLESDISKRIKGINYAGILETA